MSILRKGEAGNYTYTLNGKPVTNEDTLNYIKSLVIPPAYRDVVIFYQLKGEPKILYQGYDSKDRLQRIYSPMWNNAALKKKFCELLYLAKHFDNITKTAIKEINSPGLGKNKMISMVVYLIIICRFRVGNKRYQELYDTYGAMNIKKKHVKIKNDKMIISFIGKKGIVNSCEISDTMYVREVSNLISRKLDNDFVFLWDNNGPTELKATDINDWLKEFDKKITSKDFRTYDTNILLILFTRNNHDPTKINISIRKKLMVKALKEVSEIIHNTPAILKKNYAAGGIIDLYINHPIKFKGYFLKSNTPSEAFVEYLKDYCA